MNRLRFGASAAMMIVSGLFLAIPTMAEQLTPPLSSETRTGLLDASKDVSIPWWQREFMSEVAYRGSVVQTTTSADSTASRSGTWNQLPPPSARGLHAAIYDPVRDRMVVFGGYSTRDLVNDVWVLELTGHPRWVRLKPVGGPPTARHLLSAIYDAGRDRMIVYGGLDREVGYRDDLWALSLGSTPGWSRILTTGAGPGARARHSAIYDPAGDRMIVFGGCRAGADGGPSNDAWALSLSGRPAWTRLSPNGPVPSARYDQSAVYDSHQDRLLVFGGFDGQVRLNDVWSLSLRGAPWWRPLDPTGVKPTPRLEHSAIYDPVGDRMVVFSGLADGYVSDTWSLSLRGRTAWTRIESRSEPSVRWGHSAVYDSPRRRMVVFGGEADRSRLVSEIWGLSLSTAPTWTNMTTSDTPPEKRWGHSVVYDAAHERMILFGGYDEPRGFLNDVWMLELSGRPVWTLLHPSGTAPGPRAGHTAIYDAARDRMLVFGGEGYDPSLSSGIWALSLSGEPSWTALSPVGRAPEPRTLHTAIHDASHDRMIVYGGVGATAYLGDVWALSLSAPSTWTQLSPTGAFPSARAEHSAIYDPVRNRMVVFGGMADLYFRSDVWALSLGSTPAWTEITLAGTKPAVRSGHRAIYDSARDRMVVSGGFNYSGGSDPTVETWALALDHPGWTLLQPTGSVPNGMESHSAIYEPAGDRMLVFGGYEASGDLWELRWGSASPTVKGFSQGSLPAGVVDLASPSVSPNPSRSEVTISFSVRRAGECSVRIHDVAGRTVRVLDTGILPAGPRTIRWDRRTAAGVFAMPGLYFCEVRADGGTSTKRIVLVQ